MNIPGYIKNILIKAGSCERFGGKSNDIFKKRKELSFAYISGSGIEIGALHAPLPVQKGVEVKYVDCETREESVKKFPELDPAKIVQPSYIDNGFSLSSVPESSQDFIIANHVLEHSPNPVQALELWAKILRRQGVLFVSVPVAEKCFDAGRPTTSIEHFFEDYNLCKENRLEEFAQNNREHYMEWITISAKNIAGERGSDYSMPSLEKLKNEIDGLASISAEIHFHTFSLNSCRELLSLFSRKINQNIKVESVVDNNIEVVAILRKM